MAGTTLLTETKWIKVDPFTDWNNDTTSLQDQSVEKSTPNNAATADPDTTSLKTTTQLDSGHGGAHQKTGFPAGTTRLSAVIAGQLAGSEDGSFEDYFNPCIITLHALIATSPTFTAAVNLRRHPQQHLPNADDSHTIEVVQRRPWEHCTYRCNIRSQEAL